MSPGTIAFEVRGIPIPQGSTRDFLVHGKVRITTVNRGLTLWRRLVADVAQHHAPNELWRGPLAVTLLFRLPEPKRLPKRRRVWPDRRPDLDQLCRACLDSLTGILWRDDSQVVRLEADKDYGPPGVLVWVEQVPTRAERAVAEGVADALSFRRADPPARNADEFEEFYGRAVVPTAGSSPADSVDGRSPPRSGLHEGSCSPVAPASSPHSTSEEASWRVSDVGAPSRSSSKRGPKITNELGLSSLPPQSRAGLGALQNPRSSPLTAQ